MMIGPYRLVLAFVNALVVYDVNDMAAPRRKRSPRFSTDAVEVISGRVSKSAKQLLEREAKIQQIPLAIHVRRILYRHLKLFEGEA